MGELRGGLSRMLASAATYIDAELFLHGFESAFQSAHDRGRDTGRMPIHSHDGAEALKPKGMSEASQELVAAVLKNNGLGDDVPERGHSRRQPGGNPAAVKG